MGLPFYFLFTMAITDGRPHHHHHRLCYNIIAFTLLFLSLVATSYGATDAELLLTFKNKLQNTGALSSWNPSTQPCSGNKGNWKGVLCVKGKIWGLKLEGMGLKGDIDVDSLKGLSYLRTISFMNNQFDGTLPKLGKVVALKAIYLSDNKFSGVVTADTFDGMQWLKRIQMSNNQFTGPIPVSLGNLQRLSVLSLDGNQFSGPIPQFKQKLQVFNVANNQLEGPIPATLTNLPASTFAGNKGLCGPPMGACNSLPPPSDPPPTSSNPPILPSNLKKNPSTGSIVVVGIVVALALIVIGAVIFILHRRRQKNRTETITVENPDDSSVNNNINNQVKKGKVRELGDEGRRSIRSIRSLSSNRSRRGDHLKLSFMRNDTEKFDLQDLLRASAEILGSGLYSSSYKASLSNGPQIVVKRFKQMNNVGKEEFQEHMRRIGRLDHPNLHPLVAYYYRREEKLLVTNHVKNGSLAVRLHGYQALGEPSLDWPIRLKIVKGIARGLEHLYKELPSLIGPHGNLKSSNVLLTESFEPLLCDYGLVPVINQDLAQDIVVIYKTPEYIHHGRISKKSDVWCLGIVILEILTGKFPASFLQQGKGSEVSLANWVDSIVPEEWTNEVFDKDMGGKDNSEGEMVKLLKIALGCCEVDVDKRWDLKEAVEKIQEVKEKD